MTKQILGVTKGRDDKSFWTKIGVAFENKDGSWNLKFDFFPMNTETTIQIRPFRDKSEVKDGATTDAAPPVADSDIPF